jgi:tetratricopeptide (TPR) repeat protein
MRLLSARSVLLGWFLCAPVIMANASAAVPGSAGAACEMSDAAPSGTFLSAGRLRQERERLERGLLGAALDLGPVDKAALLTALARLKLASGDSAGAATDLQQAVELTSDAEPALKAALLHDLGNAFAAGERYPEAAAEYARSLQTLPPGQAPELSISNRLNQARALIDAGRAADAARPLEAASTELAAAPDEAWVKFVGGIAQGYQHADIEQVHGSEG